MKMTKSQMEVAAEEFGLELTCSFGLYRILDNGVEVATATHTCGSIEVKKGTARAYASNAHDALNFVKTGTKTDSMWIA